MKQNQIKSSPMSRRQFISITAVAGATYGLHHFGLLPPTLNNYTVRRSRPLMGTTVNLTVCAQDRDQAEAAVDAAMARMQILEQRLSRHHPESELSLLNRTGQLTNSGSDLRKVLQLGRQINDKTEGAFDMTILPLLTVYQQYQNKTTLPDRNDIDKACRLVGSDKLWISGKEVRLTNPGMGISLDGIGKGYIVDQGVATLKTHGFSNIFVEAGGDIMACGSKPGGRPWRIGLQNPRSSQKNAKLVTIETKDRAIATSGDYIQFFSPNFLHHHIINPRTGFSPPELASCTVVAPTVALADALATGAMVLGAADAIDLLESTEGWEGYLVDKNLKTYQTSGFFS